MKLRFLLGTAAAFLAASTMLGQLREGTAEIEPFAGYLFGGTFARGTTDVFNTRVNVDDQFAYGGRIGYNITSLFEIEGQFARSETHFVTHTDGGLFGGGSTQRLGDLNINYWLGYMTFNFGHSRAVPYVSFGAGVATLDPRIPGVATSSDTRFTASAGTGIKLFFNPHFGVRLDGRYYATSLNRNRDRCDDFFHDCSDRRDWLSNGTVTGGLLFAF